jgi:hypothetical protein
MSASARPPSEAAVAAIGRLARMRLNDVSKRMPHRAFASALRYGMHIVGLAASAIIAVSLPGREAAAEDPDWDGVWDAGMGRRGIRKDQEQEHLHRWRRKTDKTMRLCLNTLSLIRILSWRAKEDYPVGALRASVCIPVSYPCCLYPSRQSFVTIHAPSHHLMRRRMSFKAISIPEWHQPRIIRVNVFEL